MSLQWNTHGIQSHLLGNYLIPFQGIKSGCILFHCVVQTAWWLWLLVVVGNTEKVKINSCMRVPAIYFLLMEFVRENIVTNTVNSIRFFALLLCIMVILSLKKQNKKSPSNSSYRHSVSMRVSMTPENLSSKLHAASQPASQRVKYANNWNSAFFCFVRWINSFRLRRIASFSLSLSLFTFFFSYFVNCHHCASHHLILLVLPLYLLLLCCCCWWFAHFWVFQS